MPPLASIHQAIHGYREGHRLLSSSVTLNADAARAMLVLSDMSGPAMQPGFDEYLTAYPVPGSELYAFAKTWYAPEMRRPGCVWTHSLLLSLEQASELAAGELLAQFRRPQEGVEVGATTPLQVDTGGAHAAKVDGFGDAAAAALVGAVLGQARPVIVPVEHASQLELAFLRLWEELWPAARARFSFCTGALLPRSVSGALMDLQAVPRAIPSSQFRKSAGAALLVDLRTPNNVPPWVKLFMHGAERGGPTFRLWLDDAVGGDASRAVIPSLVSIFAAWHAQDSSVESLLTLVTTAKELAPSIRDRLVRMVFDRADVESGAAGRRELLQAASTRSEAEVEAIATVLEAEARVLFHQSRAEGVALVLSLLGSELTEAGERVLRAAVLLLAPSDLESFGDSQAPFLATIAGANPLLASSPLLWSRVGVRSAEVLSQLGELNPNADDRGAVLDAILAAGGDVSVDAFIRFGGEAAIFRGLAAIATGQIELSWPWRSALIGLPDTVLEWLESLSPPSLRDLELGSRFINPKARHSRLAAVWKAGIAGSGTLASRVAAFGLTLALWEAEVKSPLLAACFQPTYDAAGASRLEYDEWDWLREYAPSSSYWREWDKCHRLATAISLMFAKQSASLETLFGAVLSKWAILKIVAILDDDRDTRPYLKSLRKAAEASSVGTDEQRQALLGKR